MAPQASTVPARIRVRMYQVGFGDCFLVSFEYDRELDGRDERHVLIDFGSTRAARTGAKLIPIAELIREHSHQQLDAVVVSHRHKDHLSAFGDPEIAELLGTPNSPRLVVLPWTEDPALSADARAPKEALARRGRALENASAEGSPGMQSLGFLRTLHEAQGFADVLARQIAAAPSSEIGDELKQLAEDQLRNRAAVDQLHVWAKGGRAAYLHYGRPSRIEEVVPGVRVSVLGPPTMEQHEEVQTQRSSDPEEFWELYRRLARNAHPRQLLEALVNVGDRGAASPDTRGVEPTEDKGEAVQGRTTDEGYLSDEGIPIGPTRWVVNNMARQQINSFLRIVRILDDVLNNTSLILLFDVEGPHGMTRMLFPGDAQIENWEYALKHAPDKKANLNRLKRVDLYKVGHHGSRNSTPKSLFGLWMGEDTRDHPMIGLMSTKPGVHGKHAETAVPRATLIRALEERMTGLYSTTRLKSTRGYWEVEADLSAGTGFTLVARED